MFVDKHSRRLIAASARFVVRDLRGGCGRGKQLLAPGRLHFVAEMREVDKSFGKPGKSSGLLLIIYKTESVCMCVCLLLTHSWA